MKNIFSLLVLALLSVAVAAQTHEVSLSVSPANSGSVGFYSGPSSTTSSRNFREGEEYNCYAKAKTNYRFVAWKQGNTIVSDKNPMTVRMGKDDVAYTAVFVLDPADPDEPGINYFDRASGELRIVNFKESVSEGYSESYSSGGFSLSTAINKVIGDDAALVVKLTVIGVLPATAGWDGGISVKFSSNMLGKIREYVKEVDLSQTNVTAAELGYSVPQLTHLLLPASLDNMQYFGFSYTPELEEVTILAPDVPKIDPGTWGTFKDISDEVVFRVPKAALPLYEAADGWKDRKLVGLDDATRFVEVRLPDNYSDMRYQGMTLVADNLDTRQQFRYVAGQRQSILASGLPMNSTYNFILQNSYGQQLAHIDGVELKEENMSISFTDIADMADASISVVTPAGDDVTAKAQLRWTLADGTEAGQRATVERLLSGTTLSCAVTLGEELANLYVAPAAPVQLTANAGSGNQAVLQLQPLLRIELKGRVLNSVTGLPVSGASVVMAQQIGGRYSRSFSTETDDEGRFTLTPFSEPGELTVTAIGNMTYRAQLEGSSTGVTLDDISLRPIEGARITVSLSYTPAVAAGETAKTQEEWTDINANYTLYNITEGQAVTDVVIQGLSIVALSGVKPGDELELTVSSRTDSYDAVKAVAVVDDDNTAHYAVAITQRGGLKATASATSAAGLGLLYGAQSGELVRQASYGVDGLTMDNLSDGDYTLVSLGVTDIFRKVLRIQALSEMGLVEGTDYVKNEVSVQQGTIRTVSTADVQVLDESRFYYTSKSNMNTYFMATHPELMVGDYQTLKAKVTFLPELVERVSDIELVVDLPEGVSLVPSSLREYSLDGQRVIIPVNGQGSLVRFCVAATKLGEFVPSASVRFRMDGEQLLQPIGSAWFKSKNIEFAANGLTITSEVGTWGTAPKTLSGSQVEIYDNNILVANSMVGPDGKFNTQVPLYKPLRNSWHQLYAKIHSLEFGEIESPVAQVQCDPTVPVLKGVKMINFGIDGDPDFRQETYFNCLTGEATESYVYFIYKPEITFVADFAEKADMLQNVQFLIKLSDGTLQRLPATYDAEQGWMASFRYTEGWAAHNKGVPTNATVEFGVRPDRIIDRDNSEMFADQVNLVHQSMLHAEQMVEQHIDGLLLSDDDDAATMVVTSDNGRQMLLSVTSVDYEKAEQEMRNNKTMQVAKTAEDGALVISVVFAQDSVVMWTADPDERVALKTVLKDYVQQSNAARRGPGKWLTSAFDFGSGVLDLVGVTDYLDAPSDHLRFEIKRDTYYNRMRGKEARFANKINAKCGYGFNDPGFSNEQKANFNRRADELWDMMEKFYSDCNKYLKDYWKTLGRNVTWNVGTSLLGGKVVKGAGMAVKFAASKSGKVASVVQKASKFAKSEAGELLQSGMEFDKGLADELYDLPSIEDMLQLDFKDFVEDFNDYTDLQYEYIMNGWDDLLQDMKNTADDNCKEEDENECPPEWLPVPPPQLDVNLELKQNTQPEVKSATAYDEGINIEFDKFMKPLLLTTDNISVKQNGEAVSGQH